MQLKPRLARDTVGGLFIAAIGVFFLEFALELPMGSAARMGAGYFPVCLSALLIFLGLAISLKGTFTPKKPHEVIYRFDLKRLVILCGSVLLFAILLPAFGLFIALTAMIVLSTVITPGRSLREVVLLVLVINALVCGVFIFGIHLEVPLWPVFLGGD